MACSITAAVASGASTTSPRRGSIALPPLVPPRRRAPRGRSTAGRLPGPRAGGGDPARSGTRASVRARHPDGCWASRAGGACRRCPSSTSATPETRAYLLDVAEHWLRFGIDGWRLDVAEEIGGDYWEEFRERCRAVRPGCLPGGRRSGNPSRNGSPAAHFDALMNYPLAEAILGYAAGRHLDLRGSARSTMSTAGTVVPRDGASFAAELERLQGLYDPDVTRGDAQPPRQPRRAADARTVCGGDLAAMRIATLLQMTLPGAPCIYYGDEVGLEGEQDPFNRRCVPVGARPMGQVACARSCAELVGLRKRHAGAARRRAPGAGALTGTRSAMARRAGGERFVVATNAGDSDARLHLTLPDGYWLDRGSQRADHRRHRCRDRAGAGGRWSSSCRPRTGTGRSASRPGCRRSPDRLSVGAAPILAPRGGPVDQTARSRSSDAIAARHGHGGAYPGRARGPRPDHRSGCRGGRTTRTPPCRAVAGPWCVGSGSSPTRRRIRGHRCRKRARTCSSRAGPGSDPSSRDWDEAACPGSPAAAA